MKESIRDLINRGLERREKNLLLPTGEAEIDEQDQRERHETVKED
ncbi:MAG: hypothetical protein ABEK50_00485 [bacterium]